MSDHDQLHPVDRLVRRHLEIQADQLVTEALARRVIEDCRTEARAKGSSTSDESNAVAESPVATIAMPASGDRGRRKAHFWKRTIGIVASVLTVIFAFVIGRWDTPAQAEPDGILRAAISSHTAPIERCYLVSIERNPQLGSDLPSLRDVRVWTQGNRFWVDVNRGDRNWAWGRTAQGEVWLTLGPRRAIRIEADEIGTPLNMLCDIYSLELESLLTSALDHFELHRRQETATTHVITARPRRTAGPTREFIVEFDKETKAVRRLEIQRVVKDQQSAKIVFTLIDSRTPDESKYEPEGHLSKPYQVLTPRGREDRRRGWLTAWFGPGGSRWIRSRPMNNQ